MSTSQFLTIINFKDLMYQTMQLIYTKSKSLTTFSFLLLIRPNTKLIFKFISIIFNCFIWFTSWVPSPFNIFNYYPLKSLCNSITIEINNKINSRCINQGKNNNDGGVILVQQSNGTTSKLKQRKNSNEVPFDENKVVQWKRMKIVEKYNRARGHFKKERNEVLYKPLLLHALAEYRDFLGYLNDHKLYSLFKRIYLKITCIETDDEIRQNFRYIKDKIHYDPKLRKAIIDQLVNQVQGHSFLSPIAAIHYRLVPCLPALSHDKAYLLVKESIIKYKVHSS